MSYFATVHRAEFVMSDQKDSEEIARLKQVNGELNRSLTRCRKLVQECRSKLAANSNEPMFFDNDDQTDREGDESDSA
jgi:hypothetical protein